MSILAIPLGLIVVDNNADLDQVRQIISKLQQVGTNPLNWSHVVKSLIQKVLSLFRNVLMVFPLTWFNNCITYLQWNRRNFYKKHLLHTRYHILWMLLKFSIEWFLPLIYYCSIQIFLFNFLLIFEFFFFRETTNWTLLHNHFLQNGAS